MIKLFSTDCPKCKMLKAQLERKNIEFDLCENEAEVLAFAQIHNLLFVPILQVDDALMDFNKAIDWSNKKGATK